MQLDEMKHPEKRFSHNGLTHVQEEETMEHPNLTSTQSAARAGTPRGMTLVEIMIVITIMASIMGVVGFYVFGTLTQAQTKNAKMGINQLEQIVQTHYMLNNKMPSSLNELTEGDNPLVESEDKLDDPWGNKYIYEHSGGTNYTIYSAGPDGQQGTEDDVKPGSGNDG
jgi:general secretion pathway protein G